MTIANDLLRETEAAELLGLKPHTLARWRSTRRYPLPFIKVGGAVRYRRAAIERFLEDRTVLPAAESPE